MLEPHRQRTLERMRGSQAVLCLQDGTTLNFANRPATTGLGRREGGRGEGTLGLHLQAMLAVDQRGIPLGVPRLEFDAPARPAAKSGRWLRGLEACSELAAEIGNVPLISVMDREGDFFQLFRHAPTPDRPAGARTAQPPARGSAAQTVRPDAHRTGTGVGRAIAGPGLRPRRHPPWTASPYRPAGGEVAAAGDPCAAAQRTRCHSVGGTRHREPAAAGRDTRGVAAADQPAGDRPTAGPAGAGVVSPALAHRRLVPDPQDRVPGRGPATATSREPAARREPARHDRLALGGAHPLGTRDPGTARREPAHRNRTHRAARPRL